MPVSWTWPFILFLFLAAWSLISTPINSLVVVKCSLLSLSLYIYTYTSGWSAEYLPFQVFFSHARIIDSASQRATLIQTPPKLPMSTAWIVNCIIFLFLRWYLSILKKRPFVSIVYFRLYTKVYWHCIGFPWLYVYTSINTSAVWSLYIYIPLSIFFSFFTVVDKLLTRLNRQMKRFSFLFSRAMRVRQGLHNHRGRIGLYTLQWKRWDEGDFSSLFSVSLWNYTNHYYTALK